MLGFAQELLSTLKVLGQIWLDKVDKEWSKDIEKLEKKLWRETNKNPKEIDMARVVNLLEEIKRKNKRAQSYMMENVLKGKLVQ